MLLIGDLSKKAGAMEAGADFFIEKPLSRSEFENQVIYHLIFSAELYLFFGLFRILLASIRWHP